MLKTDPIDQPFIDFCVDVSRMLGWDDLTAKLMAILYLEPEPVSMDALAELAGYSLSSVSTKVKPLLQLGCIKRIHKHGEKKHYLTIEKDHLKTIRQHYIGVQLRKITAAKENMPKIIKEYRSKATTHTQKQKLKILTKHYDDMLKYETLLTKLSEELERL